MSEAIWRAMLAKSTLARPFTVLYVARITCNAQLNIYSFQPPETNTSLSISMLLPSETQS